MITRAGHIFAHVLTAEVSWHVQKYDLIGSLETKLDQQIIHNIVHYMHINCLWDGPLGYPRLS